MTAVVWFRRDLRLGDHRALLEALAGHAEIVPLFVRDPALLHGPAASRPKLARLDAALTALDRDLRARGGRLIVREGDPRIVVPAVVREAGADVVHAHRDVTPAASRRDDAVGREVDLRLHAGQLAADPDEVGDRRVFTAFHRAWEQARDHGSPLPAPDRIRVPAPFRGDPLPSAPPHGEPEAVARLRSVAAVQEERSGDRLDGAGGAHLSADLHLGTLSVRQVLSAVPVASFHRRLAWRDWSFHVLAFHPEAQVLGWDRTRRAIPWRDDATHLAAWTDGRTGYPTVDAAMRQLAAEGWISNRARLVAASFLVKHLRLDWRLGERVFLERLVDGDVAVNNLNWQWAAGVGTDRAPYVRILNPSLQGERFDPDGAWVRRWVPEVAGVEGRFVHRPWESPAGVPRDYVPPIVDHAEARQAALAMFRAADASAGR